MLVSLVSPVGWDVDYCAHEAHLERFVLVVHHTDNDVRLGPSAVLAADLAVERHCAVPTAMVGVERTTAGPHWSSAGAQPHGVIQCLSTCTTTACAPSRNASTSLVEYARPVP